jgi:hypothetical protein
LTFPPITLQTGRQFAAFLKKGKFMSKSTLKMLLALMIAISALMAQPIFGGQATPANTLVVFTEESSSILNATVAGIAFGTVSLTSPDHWTWTLPADRPNIVSFIVTGVASQFWLEPGSASPTLVNQVAPGFAVGSNFTQGGARITSDFDMGTLGFLTVADTTIVRDSVTFNYVGGSTETFDVQFIDKGDIATVPDTETTGCLFALSLTGLAFLRRKILA